MPAAAQVIEISDDGSARILGDPALGIGDSANHPGSRGGPFNIDESLDRAARAHGLDPGLLRAVAWRESRGNNAAVSVKGALGVMQLMPATAASLGVDPRDPEANINGGAAYLAAQLAAFGRVDLALAAYNAGPGAVRRFGGIPPFAETQGYVAAISRRWGGASAQSPAVGLTSTLTAPLARPTSSRRPRELPVLLIEVASE